MKVTKKVLTSAVHLGDLTLQKEGLEAEIKTLREELSKAIPAGDEFEFIAGVQKFTLINRLEDKAIMKSNQVISKIISPKLFIEIAKISKTEIEKEFGKATLSECVDHYETEPKLILKKSVDKKPKD